VGLTSVDFAHLRLDVKSSGAVSISKSRSCTPLSRRQSAAYACLGAGLGDYLE